MRRSRRIATTLWFSACVGAGSVWRSAMRCPRCFTKGRASSGRARGARHRTSPNRTGDCRRSSFNLRCKISGLLLLAAIGIRSDGGFFLHPCNVFASKGRDAFYSARRFNAALKVAAVATPKREIGVREIHQIVEVVAALARAPVEADAVLADRSVVTRSHKARPSLRAFFMSSWISVWHFRHTAAHVSIRFRFGPRPCMWWTSVLLARFTRRGCSILHASQSG